MKGKVSFGIGVIGVLICIFLNDNEPKSTIFKIALGFLIGGFIEFTAFIIENRKKWGTLKTQIFKRNQPVRLTVAYLYRIEINGQYVLIKRHKKDNPGYQPVGGTYKYFKEENREIFDKLGIEPCSRVPRDEDTENDLRIIIKRRKNLIAFLKWFESRKNREIDPYREFYEELVATNLLPNDYFKHIKYAYVGKNIEGVLKSPIYPEDELRYADIYDLRLETDVQKEAILKLKNNDEILFATPEEIRKKSTNDGKVILPHAYKILPK